MKYWPVVKDFILEKDSKESKLIEIKKKILAVAFMLLFNYLDTLPKLYKLSSQSGDCVYGHFNLPQGFV